MPESPASPSTKHRWEVDSRKLQSFHRVLDTITIGIRIQVVGNAVAVIVGAREIVDVGHARDGFYFGQGIGSAGVARQRRATRRKVDLDRAEPDLAARIGRAIQL